jgi:PBP1b-binding outer membrane lipoprotein LpoB
MKQTVLLLSVATLFLTGCGVHYYKPDIHDETAQWDLEKCQDVAEAAVTKLNPDPGTPINANFSLLKKQRALTSQCMFEKGYKAIGYTGV